MNSTFEVIRVGLLVLAIFLAVVGPPIWWYLRGRKPGERRQKQWGAILFGVLLLVSIGYIKTSKGDWIGWLANMGRFVCASWLIAWGARGSRA